MKANWHQTLQAWCSVALIMHFLSFISRFFTEDSLPGTPTEEEADTELRMRGRNIMMGYLGNEAKTREVFDEYEWLR